MPSFKAPPVLRLFRQSNEILFDDTSTHQASLTEITKKQSDTSIENNKNTRLIIIFDNVKFHSSRVGLQLARGPWLHVNR